GRAYKSKPPIAFPD
nr:Chain C, GLY-ARG-ALA-TYR-LYS-SER-LYS-PRO-PRO-ILE-ALA-PHE-PRO-ASP [Helianthus annuus]6Q1U_D Chain D, GLY-ARG-ALA-TYR-LYS-SER-LYS-PRO-PRO-ILE-ALA-PHE-PRO-ASP [Helianthus annuus]6U7X_A Chain A, GLY-ARG-ALA-TYR-LYS-SER-LYS-PRO-PRO-ILE-ALA-PHE-PRO-ASP [Helianthus annuus]